MSKMQRLLLQRLSSLLNSRQGVQKGNYRKLDAGGANREEAWSPCMLKVSSSPPTRKSISQAVIPKGKSIQGTWLNVHHPPSHLTFRSPALLWETPHHLHSIVIKQRNVAPRSTLLPSNRLG